MNFNLLFNTDQGIKLPPKGYIVQFAPQRSIVNAVDERIRY